MLWKHWVALIALTLVAAYAHAAQRPLDNGITAAVELIRAEAGGHRLLLLGEKHGTREIPDLIEALVAAYALEGPVMLGFEIPHTELPALNAYLQSDGGRAARRRLQQTPFWKRDNDQHDGRRSHDMLDLIEAMRQMQGHGRDISLLVYDAESDHGRGHHWRDAEMARRVRAAYTRMPDTGHMLILAGNVHAMLNKPEWAPAEMQVPMGAYLRDLQPFAINISAQGGKFWGCRGVCAAMTERPKVATSGVDERGPWRLQIVLPEFSVAHLIGAESAR